MNFAPPKWITESAEQALNTVAPNHYSHPRGRVRLREAIKNFYDPLLGRNLSVESEILVTSGANEGMWNVHVGAHGIYRIYMQASTPSLLHSLNKEMKSSCLSPFLINIFPP